MTVCLLTTRPRAPYLATSLTEHDQARGRFGREGVVSALDSGEEDTVVLLDARITHLAASLVDPPTGYRVVGKREDGVSRTHATAVNRRSPAES